MRYNGKMIAYELLNSGDDLIQLATGPARPGAREWAWIGNGDVGEGGEDAELPEAGRGLPAGGIWGQEEEGGPQQPLEKHHMAQRGKQGWRGGWGQIDAEGRMRVVGEGACVQVNGRQWVWARV